MTLSPRKWAEGESLEMRPEGAETLSRVSVSGLGSRAAQNAAELRTTDRQRLCRHSGLYVPGGRLLSGVGVTIVCLYMNHKICVQQLLPQSHSTIR